MLVASMVVFGLAATFVLRAVRLVRMLTHGGSEVEFFLE
jgi:hypothetical protein